MIRRRGLPPGSLLSRLRERRPRFGVVLSAIIAAVALVAAAAVWALVGGDKFGPTEPGRPTPVGSIAGSSQAPSAALRALVRWAGHTDRTFHLETRTEVTVGDRVVTVSSSLDHAAAAYAGIIDIVSERRSRHVEVVIVPPSTYLRETDGPWRSGDAPQRSLDPFAGLTAATAAADLGLETVEGRLLHHLRIALLPVDTTFGPEVKDVVYTSTDFDVWVDDVGVPVSGTFVLKGIARMSDAPVQPTIRSTFVFSRVGAPIEITVPIESPAPIS